MPGSPSSRAAELIRRRHSGRWVLLAEDNPVNREVATELLGLAGLRVDIAEDGAAAVKLALGQPYDVILMDMLMPVMHGVDAARAIRGRLGDAPPIVAMTANTSVDDLNACLDAGMNDRVVKPVDPSALYATLLRWLPVQVRTRHVESSRPAPDADGDSVEARLQRLPSLDLVTGLRNVGGGMPTLIRVLGRFAETYERGVPLLLGPSGLDQRTSWREACHSLRGACAAVGAMHLAELATEIDSEQTATVSEAALTERGLRLQVALVTFAMDLTGAMRVQGD